MLNRRFFPMTLRLVCTVALLVIALGAAPARPVQAGPIAPAGATAPEGLLNPDGTLVPSTELRGTQQLSGSEATLGGDPGPIAIPAARPVVSATPGWHALSNRGLDNVVLALAMIGSDLYVAGLFDRTADVSLANLGGIARYDTKTGIWHALANKGLNDRVQELAVVGSDLYVGGTFTHTRDYSLALNKIARYDTISGTWHALSRQGLDGAVYELTVVGADLYVGGDFDRTADGSRVNLGGIARYSTATGTWQALKNQGFDNTVRAIVEVGSNLYVGGHFTQTGDGSLTNLGYIARYDIGAGIWHALPKKGLNNWIYSLAAVGSDLYLGGEFNGTGDYSLALNKIARYDMIDDTWNGLPNQGLSNFVFLFQPVGSDLYVGGGFTQTGDASRSLNRIARYRIAAGTWHGLRNQGLDASVIALAVSGDDLYMGGWFTQTADGAVTNLNRVARYREVPYLTYLPLLVR